jgi:5-methylcytosine-specific restriction endonuclease McrA
MTTTTTTTTATQPLVARLSTYPQERVLNYFWHVMRQLAREHTTERLFMLGLVGEVTIARPLTWDYAAIRREHEQGPRRTLHRHQCFVCAAPGPLYLHHIVEVHHGGDNHPRNLVPLCFRCHQALHPWLIPPAHTSNWVPLRAIMTTMLEDLFAGGGGLGSARAIGRQLPPGAPTPTVTSVTDHAEVDAAISEETALQARRPRPPLQDFE